MIESMSKIYEALEYAHTEHRLPNIKADLHPSILELAPPPTIVPAL